MAAATQERSNCLGCQGGLVYSFVLHLLGVPRRPRREHGVEYGQKLVPTGRQGDFCDLPRREKPLVKDCDAWDVARGHERAHGEHGAHVCAASPHGAPTPQGPTGAMEGRPPSARTYGPSRPRLPHATWC